MHRQLGGKVPQDRSSWKDLNYRKLPGIDPSAGGSPPAFNGIACVLFLLGTAAFLTSLYR